MFSTLIRLISGCSECFKMNGCFLFLDLNYPKMIANLNNSLQIFLYSILTEENDELRLLLRHVKWTECSTYIAILYKKFMFAYVILYFNGE